MKKLIVITGSDGSGKSTLTKCLLGKSNRLREVSIWDAMDPNLFKTKADIDNYLCTLTANARALFLAHALVQGLEKAEESSAEVLVANGYYYKYFASELALGADGELIKKLSSFFPKPDFVIKLEVDSSVAFKRKERLSRYECGLKKPSEETFVSFQKLAKAEWAHFDQTDWHVLSGEQPKEVLCEQAYARIKSHAL